jgi:hypothetical protein
MSLSNKPDLFDKPMRIGAKILECPKTFENSSNIFFRFLECRISIREFGSHMSVYPQGNARCGFSASGSGYYAASPPQSSYPDKKTPLKSKSAFQERLKF